MLRKIVDTMRRLRTEARRNRVWVILINEKGPRMLSPAYFKQYFAEQDQVFGRKPVCAAVHLKKCLPGLASGVELSYLREFKLEGVASYKSLHVFYAILPFSEQIPKPITDYLTELYVTVPQHNEVRHALDLALANDHRYTLRQLQADGVI